jgi:cyclopropane fatty-acyl-phospholipid synthase-like methyltransferase
MVDQNAAWSARYRAAGEDFLFGVTPNRFLEHRVDLLREGLNALSVADGEGRNSVWLAEQGLDVTAVEITEVAVAKARKLAAGRNVTVNFEVVDMLAPDWPPQRQQNAFDWVIGIFIQFVGPAERQKQIAALQRATRPGGRVLLQGYTPKQLDYKTGGPSAVENLYTTEILKALFAGWTIEQLVEYEDDITEGIGHKGQSALIGMIARKPE